jgi:hypothetical protein
MIVYEIQHAVKISAVPQEKKSIANYLKAKQ